VRSIRIETRTLPPTETKDKRVRVRSQDGTVADYPWDHRYDAHEVHYFAARKVAVMENPNQEITVVKSADADMGYVFLAVIGRVAQ
jgi:hypothetical protein